MKRFLIVVFMLLALAPAAFAGTAESRYDLTIGGYIKLDAGYSNQDTHSDPNLAIRESSATRKNLFDEYQNTFFSSGETRLNFAIKGPDILGAKSSAFLEGDFRGVSTGNQYGGFQLRLANIELKWTKVDLLIGQAWQQFGMIYERYAIGFSDFYSQMMGTRIPQVSLRYNWTKEFNTMIGILSPTEWSGLNGVRQYNDSYARNGLPYLQYEFEYKTERFGKVGPQMLRFALGGMLGREKKTNTAAPLARYVDDDVPVWVTAFRYYIPIIAQKKESRANALTLNGNFFIGQNFGGLQLLGVGGTSVGSYFRPSVPGLGYATTAAAPTAFGSFAQLSYYFANNVWINAMYGYLKYNYSTWARGNLPGSDPLVLAGGEIDFKGPNQVNMNQTYGINLLYEPSNNMRLGVQWLRTVTTFNGYATPPNGPTVSTVGSGNLSKKGTLDQYRVAAYYFF